MKANLRLLPLFCLLAVAAGASAMDIKAEAAIIVDADSGKVLWQKNGALAKFPASTTKIMTALLLIERCLPDDVIVAPDDIETVKESSMHLKPGEHVTAHDMLYAIMLRSANDGCVAIAKHISGSVAEFAKLMNERAKQLGCKNTRFNNPNGLNDKLHTTSAYDLALMAREAMKHEAFRKVVKTQKREIERSINLEDRVMVNRNKWLKKDATADGIKTGYTRPAGYCYVGSATRNGFRVITVVLKSPNWQLDHKQMLEWSFKNFEVKTLKPAFHQVALVPVEGGVSAEVAAGPEADLRQVVRKGKATSLLTPATPPVVAPIARGQVIAEAKLVDPDGFERAIPLVALDDVPAQSPVAAKVAGLGTSYTLIGGTLVAGTYLLRRKSRRTRFHARTTSRPRI